MAVYLYKVDGVYETDKGSSKDYTNFNFEIKLSRFFPEGAGSHILRRFLPILIRKQKNKPPFSAVKSWLITDVQKINDEFPLAGKAIEDMDEMQIQELACMYDIFEIPLPSTMGITELRQEAMLAYLKKVLNVPMKTPEEQEQSDFFKRQPDGTLKLDFGEEKLVVEVINKKGEKKEVKKKTLSDYIKSAGQAALNSVLALTGNDGQDSQEENSGIIPNSFPSMENLQNGAGNAPFQPPLN